MSIKINRKPKICTICGRLLEREESEDGACFSRRTTCRGDCMRKKHSEARVRRAKAAYCFCGQRKPTMEEYCCWDHRLIAIKCRQWGFEPDMKRYQMMMEQLDMEQIKYNKRYDEKQKGLCL